MNPESIMLSELNQGKKDKYSSISLICGISKNKLIETESRLVIARARRMGEMVDGNQGLQNFIYKMNKFEGSNA